jgi:hypothetical protein
MKNNLARILLAWLLLQSFSFAQNAWQPAPIFVNTGKLYVGSNSTDTTKTTLYVKGSILVRDSSDINQDGITEVTGHFVQNAKAHAFGTSATGYTTGTGIFVFSGETSEGLRYISSDTTNLSFDRSDRYITFPHIEIRTNDEIVVPSRMGIDAISVIRPAGYYGKLRLKSESNISDGKAYAYDASLRITGSGSSAGLVTAGAVIVERDVTPYIDSVAVGQNTPMFGFASPFDGTQVAGYFAGNWVSEVQSGANGDVAFPLSNTTYFSNNGTVLGAGDAQYVRLRDKKADYIQALASGVLPIVSGQDINKTKTKFEFDGNVYDYSTADEQLFASDALSRTVSSSSSDSIKWVIGNSFTAPISINKLATGLQTSSLAFDGKIYLLPAGSSSFVGYNYTNPTLNSTSVAALTEIPATTTFMLKLAPGSTAGTFSVTKDMLAHGLLSHSLAKSSLSKALKSSGTVSDKAEFIVSLASNPNIFDMASVAVYDMASANYDSYDAYKDGFYPFGLYTLSKDGTPLSANITPIVTDSIPLCFKVTTLATDFQMNVSQLDLVNAEGLWLQDKLNGTLKQLSAGDTYGFTASPEDDANRFTVYFVKPESTSGIDNSSLLAITAIQEGGVLTLCNLGDIDKDSKVAILDMQGRGLLATTITDIPAQTMDVGCLAPGIYVVQIDGQRKFTTKFIR